MLPYDGRDWRRVTEHAKSVQIVGLRNEAELEEILDHWTQDTRLTAEELVRKQQVEFEVDKNESS